MKNEIVRIPNVLPIGVLEPIENDDLIIAQLKYESKKINNDISNVIDRRAKDGKKHK